MKLKRVSSPTILPSVVALSLLKLGVEEWQKAVQLLVELEESLQSDVVSYNAAITASVEQWSVALFFLMVSFM
eukprot:symbB.v1.2.032953.t1/scaffold4031.1/size45867/3